jgi:hypothetical protein
MGFLSAKIETALLSSFEDINSNVEAVNRGGCGFFAKHLYDVLKLKGYNPELIILVREWSVETANDHINNNSISDLFSVNWCHVMVKVIVKNKPVYIDSHGFFKKIKKHPTFSHLEPVDLPYDMLKVMLGCKYKKRWNPRFNRLQSKKIKNTLVKYLELSK